MFPPQTTKVLHCLANVELEKTCSLIVIGFVCKSHSKFTHCLLLSKFILTGAQAYFSSLLYCSSSRPSSYSKQDITVQSD